MHGLTPSPRRLIVQGWWGSAPDIMSAPWTFLSITTNRPDAMLARVTNWLVASHPELHPRENQPVFGRLPNNVAGHTDKGFLSSTITIDPAKNLTDAAYVDTFSHELLHVQDSWWKEFVIGLFPGPEQNDWFGFHQAIYDQGTAITIQFDEQIAGGR